VKIHGLFLSCHCECLNVIQDTSQSRTLTGRRSSSKTRGLRRRCFTLLAMTDINKKRRQKCFLFLFFDVFSDFSYLTNALFCAIMCMYKVKKTNKNNFVPKIQININTLYAPKTLGGSKPGIRSFVCIFLPHCRYLYCSLRISIRASCYYRIIFHVPYLGTFLFFNSVPMLLDLC